MNDKLRAAHEKLEQAVAEIASGDGRAADAAGCLQVPPLRLQQPPDDLPAAAGCHRRGRLQSGKSLVRFVKKGEKGIAIFSPCRYKTTIETDAGEEQTVQQITRLPRPARLRYLTDGRRRPPGRALRGPGSALLPGRGLPRHRPSPRVASRHGRRAVRQGRP